MPESAQSRIERVRMSIHLQRPDRLPCSETVWVEWRPDVYHLGEMDHVPALGEVAVSEDGKRRFTRDGGVWAVGDRERFRDFGDVLAADPLSYEVETPDAAMVAQMSALMTPAWSRGFAAPLHYGTLMTRATIEFGWEPFLMAAALEPERFAHLLERFGQASLAVVTGWAQTPGTELIVIHDDIAGTRGLILSPEWCRQFLFPWYRRLFDAVHTAGRKVLYMSDGNYLPVLDDILSCGPDGLFIESSSMDPETFMRQAGPGKFFLVKTDNRNVDVGTPQQIRQELARLRELHMQFPGMLMYRGGGNPSPENAQAFADAYREYLVYA